jgi:hypothetical protein
MHGNPVDLSEIYLKLNISSAVLKGLKREIFGFGIFAQIRPIWIGDLGTRPKNQKSYVWGLTLPFISRDFCFSAVGDSAKKNLS